MAYDGSDFCGWAEQRERRTVCGTLKTCISRAAGEQIELRGASRTDSGAHAVGQTADFATRKNLPVEKWTQVLNKLLPPDVMILSCDEVPLEFHSRFFARSRVYEYRVSERSKLEPAAARYVHPLGAELDLNLMKRAARLLKGEHDFRMFGEQLSGVKNTVRTMKSVAIFRQDDLIVIQFEANAFLRGMVRRLSGALVELGAKRRTFESFEALLNGKNVRHTPKVLPANGLWLMQVKYGKRLRDLRQEKMFELE